jgi:hypothetical protein
MLQRSRLPSLYLCLSLKSPWMAMDRSSKRMLPQGVPGEDGEEKPASGQEAAVATARATTSSFQAMYLHL